MDEYALFRGARRRADQFRALVRKNYLLKTKGILRCCTLCEIMVPVLFVALMCIPKALVPDERTNDEFARPYSLAGGMEAANVRDLRGFRFLVSPESAETMDLGRRAYVNMVCLSEKSEHIDRSFASDTDPQRVSVYNRMHEQAQRSTNVATGVKAAFESKAFNNTAMANACSDACLRSSTCFNDEWDVILDEVVATEANETAAMTYINARPGEVFAYAKFDSGGDISATSAFDYTLRLNSTNVKNKDEKVAEFMDEDFTSRWDSTYNSYDWTGYKAFLYAQNAFDGAIIDMKDGNGDFSVLLDTSVKAFPWLGFDYNIGGVIAAAFYGFVGALAFQTNVVLVMKSIVVEKELRLREGMKIMGLTNSMFWSSWFVTHWLSAMISVILVTLVGIYPFAYTDQFIQFLFYSLWVASLTLWNFFISTFFSRSITATIVGCFAYVLTMVPAIAIRITAPEGSRGWISSCIFPSGAMNTWGAVLAILEVNREGITWKTFNSNVTLKGNVSPAGVFGMVIFDCFLYAFLTFYFDAVWRTEYGVRQPPWFLFTRRYWFGDSSRAQADEETLAMDQQESGESVEPLTRQQMNNASIIIRGMTKRFGEEVTAVNDLSMTFVPGQVSGLLGHNGAGKTTAINILTGLIERTSGKAVINGYDTETQMQEVRASLGICPQFDVLWPTLTVREHLELYAAFAGMRKDEVNRELTTAIEEVALTEKIDANSSDLSGGMKRKLSLAIAFIGNPAVVFLDEPTSGMDPYSRRFTWDVIRRRAANCTVLLTTHFLDEADLLCDRVAIMSAGSLACIGSPLFLKSKFGTGYLLTFARSRASSAQLEAMTQHNTNNVLRIVKEFVPRVQIHSDVGAELSFSLPFESTSQFSALFKALDDRIESLGYSSYGISCTTLEEVFLSLAHGVGKKIHNLRANDAENADDEREEDEAPDARMLSMKRKAARDAYTTGGALLRIQLRRLLWKRMLNWKRTARSAMLQLIVPCMMVVLALYMTTLRFTPGSVIPEKTIGRNLLGNKKTIVSHPASDAEAASVTAALGIDSYSLLSQYLPEVSCMCGCLASSDDINFAGLSCCSYNRTTESACNLVIAARASGNCVKSTKGWDVQGDVLGISCSSRVDASIDAHLLEVQEPSMPCQLGNAPCDAMYVNDYTNSRYTHTLSAHQTAIHGMPAAVNTANQAILRRRAGNVALKTRIHFYPSNVLKLKEGDVTEAENADTAFIVSMFTVMGLAVLSASVSIFPVYERCNNSKHLQLVSGIDKRMYWLAHFLADMTQLVPAFVIIVIIFAGFNASYFQDQLGAIAVLLLMFMITSIPHAHFQGFWYSSEYYTFVGQIGMNSVIGVITTIAGIVTDALKDLNKDTKLVAKIFNNVFPFFIPHFSFGKGLYDIAQNGLDKTRQVFREDCLCLKPVVAKGSFNVIADDIGYLIGTFFMWSALLFYREYKENISNWRMIRHGERIVEPSEDEDEDVRAERERVRAGNVEDDGVIIDNLSKTYEASLGTLGSKKLAVRNLSVGLHRDQCFGLLGINGAGKTTTFKMLTGEFPPSAGDAVIHARDGVMHSVRRNLNAARRLMGYCPQFNGLQPNFTAREHIEFYAAIRGMPPEEIPKVTTQLLERMDLTRYADRQAGTYSGGNKRKLSVALSLVGEPEIVFLDEPSTGMDPEARRFMWDVISSMTAGRTIVLTSHSMEECEALCNRIGIMVSGEFKCLGSLQHLKSRFSEGYSIDLRFAEGKRDYVLRALKTTHGDLDAEVVETHDTEIKLRVMNPQMKLWKIFDAVEAMKTSEDEATKIDDYSVSQTTLEQVFIRFAKEQNEETHSAPGLQQ